MRSLLISSTIGFCLTAGHVWAASCPGEHQHQKRVTVSGTIAQMQSVDGGYAYVTKQCDEVVIYGKRNKACRVGGKISATGTFYSCDVMFWDLDEGCDFDELEDAAVSCR